MLPVPVVCVAEITLLALCGAAFGPSRGRRALAWTLAAIGVVLPWLMVDVPIWRAFLALGSLFGPMRNLEMTMKRALPPLPVRVGVYLTPLESSSIRRVPPSFDARLALHVLVHGLVAAVGVALVMFADATGAPFLARLTGGLLSLYGIVDVVSNVVLLALGIVGVAAAPLQNHPILAESAGDFWGRRWNRAVGAWLRLCFFVPIARRLGSRSGALAAFTASALLHFWPALASVGLWSALSAASYFMIEGLFVLVEAKLQVPLWRKPLRHAWAIFAVLAPSPLFVFPVLRIFGGV